MAQFKAVLPGGKERTIEAQNLDHAERVCNQKYPLWQDIYILNLPEPMKNIKVSLVHEQEASDL